MLPYTNARDGVIFVTYNIQAITFVERLSEIVSFLPQSHYGAPNDFCQPGSILLDYVICLYALVILANFSIEQPRLKAGT